MNIRGAGTAPSAQPQSLVHLISVNTSISSLLEKGVSETIHVYSDTAGDVNTIRQGSGLL